jgi:hypothetical protein
MLGQHGFIGEGGGGGDRICDLQYFFQHLRDNKISIFLKMTIQLHVSSCSGHLEEGG